MWKNIVERGRPQMTARRKRIAYWIPKATNTDSEYVMWKNIVERGRPQMEKRRKRIAYWITKATNTFRICNVEKYCRAGQATDGNTAQAHCILDT